MVRAFKNIQTEQTQPETKTLSVQAPTGKSPQAYLIEPFTTIKLEKMELNDISFGTAGNHLVLTMNGKPDIILLNFVSLSNGQFPPSIEIDNGQKITAKSLLQKVSFKEIAEIEDDITAIEPAAAPEFNNPNDHGGFTQYGIFPSYYENNSKTVQVASVDNTPSTSPFNYIIDESGTAKPETSIIQAPSSPTIELTNTSDETFEVSTQFAPVDLGNLNLEKIEHISMENGREDTVKVDLDDVISTQSSDRLKISGDAGDDVIAPEYDTANGTSTEDGVTYGRFATSTGQEILVELGLDLNGQTVV